MIFQITLVAAGIILAVLFAIARRRPDRRQPLDPESRFVVQMTDDEVSCERPDGKVERVAWRDLEHIEILNTSDGPSLPDVFWVLFGGDSGCVIPWGASGGDDLLKRLQQLPGFDNNMILNAASRTDDCRMVCWRKSP